MGKKGFIGLLILIAIPVSIFYAIKLNFSQPPNSYSKKLAADLNKYPNATSWNIENKEKICLSYVNKCKEVPSEIIFTSNDSWPDVFTFYLENFRRGGWATNVQVVTSIPDSLIMGNEEYYSDAICQAVVKENNNNYLGLVDSQKTGSYIISISCFPH